MVDRHHFTPQTTEEFHKEKLLHSKDIKCFDIENIDYNYISSLFGIVLPDDVIHKKQGHERKKFKENVDKPVYDLDMSVYFDYNVHRKHFYNEDLKHKVYEFYKNDFLFFKEFGFDYIL